MSNMRNKLIIVGVGICICLLIVASFYDLQISNALYSSNNFYAVFFDCFGELPLYTLIPFSLIIIAVYFRQTERILLLLTSFCSVIIAYCTTCICLIRFFSKVLPIYFVVLVAVIVVSLIYSSLLKLSDETIKKLFKFGVFCITFCLALLLVNQAVKFIWGRCRYYTMAQLNDFSLFSNWWQINGFTGYKSFYSGHTTSAMSLICLLPLARLFNMEKKKYIALHILIFSFVILVATSRIIYGAHFLSDVTFAIIMATTIYLILFKYLGRRLFKKD